MNSASVQYDGPTLSVQMNAVADGAYEWEVALSAIDHSGTTKLGYKAAGTLVNLDAQPGQFEICVHDKDRPVWTAMPISHRADIRQKIETLLSGAVASLKCYKHA